MTTAELLNRRAIHPPQPINPSAIIRAELLNRRAIQTPQPINPNIKMTKTCPCCAETVQAEAKKCRFCATDLTRPYKPKGLKAKDHPNYRTYNFLCVLLPMIGAILGIIGMFKSDPLDKKLGEHALALSVILTVAYIIAFPTAVLLLARLLH